MLHILVTYQAAVVENSTSSCWQNQSAGWMMLKTCGMGNDFLQAAMIPWQWVTGGYFSMILVSVLVLGVYLKYQKVIYPLAIGLMLLPISQALFPLPWLTFAFIMFGLSVGLLIAWAFINQTSIE